MEAKCYPVQGLDCPNCAAKVERAMEKLSETGQVNLDFAAEKLYLTPAEGCSHAQALEAARRCAKAVEPEMRILDPASQDCSGACAASAACAASRILSGSV